MKRRIVVVAAALVAACSKPDRPETPPASSRVEVGQPAPAYAATSVTGDSVSLARLRGKVVLMNVWATWCGPCRQEIPELRALHSAYKDKGLEIVGISVDADGSEDAIRAFAHDFKMDYAIWRDPHEVVQTTFKMSGVPATFLIDRQGVLRWKATGVLEPGDTTLTRAIEAALK
jgi:cytochrome c biogenesis protein CcmG, thiol:disulfide interchange protein DsbE